MKSDFESRLVLARELLRLFRLAIAVEHDGVADHLLCALEQLARSDPACERWLEQAYMSVIGCHHGSPGSCSRAAGRH
jgi:hypothetical protein